MLLTGGKANRKSRSSGEFVSLYQTQTMAGLLVSMQEVFSTSVDGFQGVGKCCFVEEINYGSYTRRNG